MPRVLWSRRRARATDSPRPAGRRWTGRLRRGGMLARPVRLVRRVRRRQPGPAQAGSVGEGAARRPGPAKTGSAPLVASEIATITPGLVAAGAVPTSSGFELLPGRRSKARQARFLVVSLCTLASLGLGVLAILLAMRGEVGVAAACLVACALLDGIDGQLARRFAVTSPFGAQLDSLADMCAFGVAAPVVLYASVTGEVPPPAAAVACGLVTACAAVRLARFNVSSHDGRFFHGVPTTMAAAVLALMVLVDLPFPAGFQLIGVTVLALAMVSGFPYVKLGQLSKLPAWLWLVPLAGAFFDFRLTFVLAATAYLLSGPVLWLHQHRTG